MDIDRWRERWEHGRTGWDQSSVHTTLAARWGDLSLPAGATVFVPLCGASVDMIWLAERGHRVVGTESSEVAVRRFFERAGLAPAERTEPGFTVHSAGPFELWCGDHFAIAHDALRGVAAVYDRASLVALPSATRRRYAEHLAGVVAPGTRTFLLTFVYDQTEMDGPPYSVPGSEVDGLFREHFEIETVTDDDVGERNPDLMARGLTRVREELHLLRRRP